MDENLAELTREFEEATSAKLRCQQQAEATATTISLANRYSYINSICYYIEYTLILLVNACANLAIL